MVSGKSKILIVDDESVGRQLLEAIFLDEDYELDFTSNGRAALQSISMELPDLILLDVMMPEMDGFEVCIKIRSDERARSIPIILITALDDRDSRKKGLESGANDYISKPFDRNEIVTKVKNLLQLNLTANTSTKIQENEPDLIIHDELLYFTNLILESQKPLKNFVLEFVRDYIQISSETADTENDFFWFSNYESKLYLLFIENLNYTIQNKLLNILIISFLNRTIQSKQFQSAADLITQLNSFLSEKITLPNLASFQNIQLSLSLVIADKKYGGIQFSGFNNSTLIVTEDIVGKINLSNITKFPDIDNHFKNHSNILSKPATIYFLNSPALNFFETEGYHANDNKLLKKYFSDISSYTLKEQDVQLRNLFSKTETKAEADRELKIIGISI